MTWADSAVSSGLSVRINYGEGPELCIGDATPSSSFIAVCFTQPPHLLMPKASAVVGKF
jgi:hypothetical protein